MKERLSELLFHFLELPYTYYFFTRPPFFLAIKSLPSQELSLDPMVIGSNSRAQRQRSSKLKGETQRTMQQGAYGENKPYLCGRVAIVRKDGEARSSNGEVPYKDNATRA